MLYHVVLKSQHTILSLNNFLWIAKVDDVNALISGDGNSL